MVVVRWILLGALALLMGCGQTSIPAQERDLPAAGTTTSQDQGVPSTTSPPAGPDRGTPSSDMGSDRGAATAEDDMGDPVVDLGPDYPAEPPETLGDGRPAQLKVPSDYDPNMAYPLIVMLHGYGSSSAQHDIYFGLSELVDRLGFALLLVDGTRDLLTNRFWNAGPACCDLQGTGVDDVGYIARLIDEAKRVVHLDGRIGVIGHSNGGFMAHALACQRADLITAIATLAGSEAVRTECAPSAPVAVLQIHGTGDTVIGYYGGIVIGSTTRYVGARDLAESWGARLGCEASPGDGPDRDLEAFYPGDESNTRIWSGCNGHVDVQLWTIPFGVHMPTLSGDFSDQVVEHLLSFSR